MIDLTTSEQEDFSVSSDVLVQIKEAQESVANKEKEICRQLQNDVIYYLKDVKSDIDEALVRITSSIDISEQIDAKINKAASNNVRVSLC